MPNQLAGETSPYLLQHADNPVDWYAWGEAALARSREEDKPIFLSIGYAACHWCHVMEHESFEDEAIAAILNEHFVCIKVDREERPDLDQIYMNAVQQLTGHGGWPMSVFLTPDLKPFFGGTYWPPEPRMGMPGFRQVLTACIDFWKNRRDAVHQQADRLAESVRAHFATRRRTENEYEAPVPSADLLELAEGQLRDSFDFANGGFNSAPKFPHAMDLELLLRIWRRTGREQPLEMVRLNLTKMAMGGIYDHLAGGFARYSVDARWLVPHFEKMLYDNALLLGVYVDMYRASKDAFFRRIAAETAEYVLNYMTDEAGGFCSSEDADSEGVEGKFYVWTPDEIAAILGPERAERFCYVYDVSEGGNFEGKNILNLPKTVEACARLKGWDLEELATDLAACREALLAARDKRVRPGKDDKVLGNWNGLMIASLAKAGALFDEPRYVAAAARAADFILSQMRRDDGRLLHTYRAGKAHLNAYLDDYACLANGLFELYEATFAERWITTAVELMETTLKHFRDREHGGFFFTADDHEQLLVRAKDTLESSVPSGGAMAATVLVRLGKLCGRADFLAAAGDAITDAIGIIERAPTAAGQMLIALDGYLSAMPEIAMLGDHGTGETHKAIHNLRRRYLPNHVLAVRKHADPTGHDPKAETSPDLDPIFAGKQNLDPEPTVYICRKFACAAPVSGGVEAAKAWKRLEEEARKADV